MIAEAGSAAFFFRGQILHAVALAALLPVTWALAAPALEGHECRFAAAVLIAVVHQVYVWIGWRAQLGWDVWTRLFGRYDFAVWNAIFFPLLFARPVLIGVLAAGDAESLTMSEGVAWTLAVALFLPAAYVGWSIKRYFGLARASGGDHFRQEYRDMPIERRGAFAWTPNAMYVIAFGGLWSIALVARSHTALVAVLFQHAYIWVHYWTVEEPDMRLLHG